jgi:uncharacterized protein YwgA
MIVPERGWIPLYALFKLRKIVTATKLQKLIFLIETEGKIGGYSFFKRDYGPFSQELEVDVRSFSQSLNLMQTKIVEGTRYPYYVYLPTKQGLQLAEETKETIPPKVLKKVDGIIEKYGPKNYRELLEYVYTKYVIPQHTFEEIYSPLSDDLISLDNIWKKWYRDDCPASFLILAVVEYASKALSKLKKAEDPVLRGVCTSSVSELTTRLLDLTSHCEASEKCPFSFKSLFLEISDNINFLDYYCGKHGIMPNILDIDFSDFINEEELRRLEQVLANTRPSELMY